MPDGSMRLTSSALPVRTKVDGVWKKLDTDPAREDGRWEPKTAAVPVQFSDGGSDELARVQTESGVWVTSTWPLGTLPKPVVKDATATYEDVLPDIDLVLTATPAGMTEVYVIHTAEVAANPQLAELKIGTDAAQVAVGESDHATVEAADGSTLASSAPTWWDSSTRGADPGGPGGDAPLRPIDRTQDVTALGVDIPTASTASRSPIPSSSTPT